MSMNVSNVNNVNNIPTCSICLEDISDSMLMIAEKCKHVFHNDCMKEWLKNNNTCPNCRADLTDQIHAIKLKALIAAAANNSNLDVALAAYNAVINNPPVTYNTFIAAVANNHNLDIARAAYEFARSNNPPANPENQ